MGAIRLVVTNLDFHASQVPPIQSGQYSCSRNEYIRFPRHDCVWHQGTQAMAEPIPNTVAAKPKRGPLHFGLRWMIGAVLVRFSLRKAALNGSP